MKKKKNSQTKYYAVLRAYPAESLHIVYSNKITAPIGKFSNGVAAVMPLFASRAAAKKWAPKDQILVFETI